MKAPHRLLIVALLVFLTVGSWERVQAEEKMRGWTDSTGREIRAALTGFKDEDTVILRLGDGRSLPYPINKLSAEDGKYAREVYARQSSGGTSTKIDWDNPKQSDNYVISRMRRETAPGYVSTKSGWEWQIKSIEVKVEYEGSEETAPGVIRAYFYNREGKLLQKFDQPPRRQNENGTYVNAPEKFLKNETVEVYFPLTPFLEESDWAMLLVVFGSGSDYSAKRLSGKRFGALAFEEKQYLFPGWKPYDLGIGNQSQKMSNVDLEIRRVQHEKKYGYSLYFDGDYQRQRPCIMAEVRAAGKVSPGTGELKMYVFDKSGKLAVSRMRPSSANVEGSDSYVKNPQIANDEWHPVFFALDGDLRDKDYPTYVIVFQFGGKTAAAVKSSVGATLEMLDFPEKSKIDGK